MIQYSLTRSARKTMCIQIKDKTVLVKAPFWVSRGKINEFVEQHGAWIERKLADSGKKPMSMPLDDGEIARLKGLAADILPGKLEFYGKIMGVAPASLKITSAKTRFGSCSGKNGICFSYRLMMYPDDAIDYVVVHELAHINRKNHSAAFYADIAKVLPDYKSRQKLLK